MISNDISEGRPATKAEILRVLMWERKHSQKLQNRINELELDTVRLKIAMDALNDIAEIPRSGCAGRLAKAVVRFIECVKPVSFGPSLVSPPNAPRELPEREQP